MTQIPILAKEVYKGFTPAVNFLNAISTKYEKGIALGTGKVGVVVVKSGEYDSIVTHSHEFVEMVYIVNGEAENKLGDERVALKSGDFFVMADRNLRHSIHPKGEAKDFSIINIIFPYEFYQFNWEVLSPKRIFSEQEIPNLKGMIEQIAEEYQNTDEEKTVEDLKKAIWYINDRIKQIIKEKYEKQRNNSKD